MRDPSVEQTVNAQLQATPSSLTSPVEGNTPAAGKPTSDAYFDIATAPSGTAYSIRSTISSRTAFVVDVPTKPDFSESPLSFLQLLVAHSGAALALFLATTDTTIISTSLPTIITALHASQDLYPWIGVAYALPQTALQPLYGQFSDLLGRKIVLFSSITIFMVGSLLCGIAPNYTLLCVFRAITGIGGGGIVSSVWIITAELVEEEKRAQWSQALSVTWSASAIAGPLLGGIFSDSRGMLSWRWAFLINLPIGAFASFLLFASLRKVKFRSTREVSWKGLYEKFDFLGLLLFLIGSMGLVLSFSFSSQYGWSSSATLIPLALGCTALILGSIYERRTTRDALFPPAIFNNLTVGIILIISFLHQIAFNSGTFFIALYYQVVNGSSALQAGLRMLPYSLGASIASIPAAQFIAYRQRKTNSTIGQKLVIMLGLVIATIGFGLLIALREHTSIVIQEIAPMAAGIGIGMLFHAPYQVLTSALKPEYIASATSTFFLVRFTGAACGLSVSSAIFNGRLSHSSLASIIGPLSHPIDLRGLKNMQPPELSEEALRAVSSAIQMIWIVCSPCLGFALLISPLICVRNSGSEGKTKSSVDFGEKPSQA